MGTVSLFDCAAMFLLLYQDIMYVMLILLFPLFASSYAALTIVGYHYLFSCYCIRRIPKCAMFATFLTHRQMFFDQAAQRPDLFDGSYGIQQHMFPWNPLSDEVYCMYIYMYIAKPPVYFFVIV